MVATRRGAKAAQEVAPAAANTLSAPPKRGGRKKVVDETAAEPAPAANKRKAKVEPESDEPRVVKKTKVAAAASAKTKKTTTTTRAPKTAARAIRGRKAEETAVVEEVVEEKAAIVEEEIAEETAKPATRARKAPAKKVAAPKKTTVAKKAVAAVVPEAAVEAAETVKPTRRVRKAAAPTAAAPAPVLAPRATRGRKVAAPPQDSPLKVPARKPTKKAAASATVEATAPTPPIAMAKPEQIEEPFTQFPNIPSTPATFTQHLTAKRAMRELPQYPNTPTHILAPMTSVEAMAELPGYPKTPAHIKAPINFKAALEEMPSYPTTPAHIKAPSPVLSAKTEAFEDLEEPAHIVAVTENVDAENDDGICVGDEDPMDIDDEENIETSNVDVMDELPDYPTTPAHIMAPLTNNDALRELPDYPKTPAHIQAPVSVVELPIELHDASLSAAASVHENLVNESVAPIETVSPLQAAGVDAPSTPKSATPTLKEEKVATVSAVGPSTPSQASSPLSGSEFASGTPQIPENIIWSDANQAAFEELPEGYPTTPAHIKPLVSTKAALAELPDYPKTPAHITAPMTPRRALAELPSYPTTPAMAMEEAIQDEIRASVKKQTPSPLAKKQSPVKFPGFDDGSSTFAEDSELTERMESKTHEETYKPILAPLQLTAPTQLKPNFSISEPASPVKSALRSPQKTNAKTPKKAVTWDDAESDFDMTDRSFMYGAPLRGMTFYVDVTRGRMNQSFLFSGLLEDLGAKVVNDLDDKRIDHVLFKDGNKSTLEKVVASKGAIKCVNVGWVLDCEKERARLDENPYLVDLSIAMPPTPKPPSPKPTMTPRAYVPMRTPLKGVSQPLSLPSTPTSSEFDRSISCEDKENSELGIFFDCYNVPEARTVPHKKSSFLFSRSPMRTPSQPKFLAQTPIKPKSATKPVSTTGKLRALETTYSGSDLTPPRKFRLF